MMARKSETPARRERTVRGIRTHNRCKAVGNLVTHAGHQAQDAQLVRARRARPLAAKRLPPGKPWKPGKPALTVTLNDPSERVGMGTHPACRLLRHRELNSKRSTDPSLKRYRYGLVHRRDSRKEEAQRLDMLLLAMAKFPGSMGATHTAVTPRTERGHGRQSSSHRVPFVNVPPVVPD